MLLTAIERPFGGEIRTFDLPLGSQRAIEEKCRVGLGRVYGRLCSILFSADPREYNFYVDDYRETILQGLIGGRGVKSAEATKLIMNYVDGNPVEENAILATEILSAWLKGVPEGKKDAPKTGSETTTAPADSTSTQSMEQAPLSDSLPGT